MKATIDAATKNPAQMKSQIGLKPLKPAHF
jgi:hypothetical protein